MRVALSDLLEDKVSRRAKGDMARHSPRHARVKEGDHLALGVEDAGARVALVGEVLFGEVEDGHLPGGARQVAGHVGLALRKASESQVSGLALFGDDEAGVAQLVVEVRILDALGVDAALDAEEMVRRVFEGVRVGAVRVEELGDIVGVEFPA